MYMLLQTTDFGKFSITLFTVVWFYASLHSFVDLRVPDGRKCKHHIIHVCTSFQHSQCVPYYLITRDATSRFCLLTTVSFVLYSSHAQKIYTKYATHVLLTINTVLCVTRSFIWDNKRSSSLCGLLVKYWMTYLNRWDFL